MPCPYCVIFMKILHLISSAGLFGAENVALSLGRYFHGRKFDSLGTVEVILGAIRDKRQFQIEFIDKAKEMGLPTYILEAKGRFDLTAISRLKKFLLKERIDLLHTHNYKSDILGALAAFWVAKPIIATAHGFTDMTRAVTFYERLDRWFLNKYFKRVVVVTEEVLPDCPLKKKRVIPNGLEISRFSLSRGVGIDIRKKFNLKIDDIVVGTVGRLSKEKNQGMLIEAFKRFSQNHDHAKLLIVGDGPEKNNLLEVVKRQKLWDKVIFTGVLKDVGQAYQGMDIFVLTSLTEGIPLTILEAMASKVAVVATRVGGIPKIIEDRKNGLLVESQDAVELADRLESLLKDKSLSQKLTEAAFDFVKAHYSSEKMFAGYLKVYEEMSFDNC